MWVDMIDRQCFFELSQIEVLDDDDIALPQRVRL